MTPGEQYYKWGNTRKGWCVQGMPLTKRMGRYAEWIKKPYIPTASRRWPDNGHYFMATAPYRLGREAYDIGMEFRRLIVTRKDWKVYKGTHCEDAVTEKLFWKRMGK